MADAAPRGRGGFGSRGDRGGDRRGRGRGRGRRGGKQEEKEWQPVTKLGRLVKAGKITSMEQIYLHSLPIKEYQIVDFFLPKLKDEVMKVRFNKPAIPNPTMRTIWRYTWTRQQNRAAAAAAAWKAITGTKRRIEKATARASSSSQLLGRKESPMDQHCPYFTNTANQSSSYRSSPSRSRPVPVSVPVSRPSSSSVTPRVTLVSVSRPPRKSPLPSVPPSPSPSWLSSPSVAVTGVPTSVSLTLCPSSRAASVVPSPSVYVYQSKFNVLI